jgi:hypothetical protein
MSPIRNLRQNIEIPPLLSPHPSPSNPPKLYHTIIPTSDKTRLIRMTAVDGDNGPDRRQMRSQSMNMLKRPRTVVPSLKRPAGRVAGSGVRTFEYGGYFGVCFGPEVVSSWFGWGAREEDFFGEFTGEFFVFLGSKGVAFDSHVVYFP